MSSAGSESRPVPASPVPALPGPALAVLAALVLVLIAGFLLLVLAGRDTSTYTLFVAGPLVTSVIGTILSQRVTRVEQIAQTVQAQTDGQLTAKLEEIHSHLDAQTTEILDGVPVALPVVQAGKPSTSSIPAARSKDASSDSPIRPAESGYGPRGNS